MDQENNNQSLDNNSQPNQENINTVPPVQLPETVIQEAQVLPEQPLHIEKTGMSSLTKIIIGILLFAIFSAAGFYVYAQFINPFVFLNTGQISDRAFQNTLTKMSKNDYSLEIDLKVSGTGPDPLTGQKSDFEATIDSKVLVNNPEADNFINQIILEKVELKAKDGSGIPVAIPDLMIRAEAIVKKDSLYFKINSLPEIFSMFLSEKFINNWIVLDENILNQFQVGLNEQQNQDELTEDQKKIIFRFFEDKVVGKAETEKTDEGIKITYNLNGKDFYDLGADIIKSGPEIGNNNIPELSEEDLKILNSMTIKLSYEVDKKFYVHNLRFETKFDVEDMSGEVSGVISNINFDNVPKIEIPKNPTKIEELLPEIYGLMMGGAMQTEGIGF